eukprot:TRINITY_DN10426_c0_g1_i1.p1 TRINITY_DN10426_c0_g1~~TRINITY_DN10426_c0_g1_i1.p1  ORF type:complete len:617 (-),score=261.17 TRINITY_DN10426_c0_g1_i1:149-1828(-)
MSYRFSDQNESIYETPMHDTVSEAHYESKEPTKAAGMLWLVGLFFFPALAGFLFGYDIGGVSSCFNGNAESGYGGHNLAITFEMTDFEQETVTPSALLGAIIGSLLVFGVGDFLGRNGVLLVAAGFYGGGALIQGSSYTIGILYTGRIIYGIGIGFAMHSAPLYIAEVLPSQYRGFFISCKECFIVGGILVGYINGYAFAGINYGWRYIFYFAAFPATLLFIGMLFLPQSPRWLILKSLRSRDPDTKARLRIAAENALAKIRRLPVNEVQDELIEVEDTLSSLATDSPISFREFLLQRNLFRGLFIGCSLVIFQQISGQPSVLYYASSVFKDAGFSSAGAQALATIGVGVVKLLMTIVSTLVVDKYGRRLMLSIGITTMVVALMIMGFANIGITSNSHEFTGIQSWSTIIGMMTYVSGYQLGFGPISWLIISEIFPLKTRTQALSVAVICNFGSNLIVSATYLSLQNLITISGAYFLFGGIAFVSLLFVIFFVIETKGKTLEQIEAILSGPNIFVVDPRTCCRKDPGTINGFPEDGVLYDQDDYNFSSTKAEDDTIWND